MRIGLFTYGMERELTGIGNYAMRLSYALRRTQTDIDIVLLNPYPSSTLRWYEDFETYSLPLLKRMPAVLGLGSVLLAKAAVDLHLDVLHDPCGIAPFFAPRLGVKRVLTVHDAVPFVLPWSHSVLTRFIFRTFVAASPRTADAVITDSLSSMRDLTKFVRYGPAQISVAYPGVDHPTDQQIAEFHVSLPRVLSRLGIDVPYFLYVGALNPRKNLVRLAEAFELLQRDHPDAHLVVAGPATWDSQAAVEALRRLGKSARILGFVDHETLNALYVGAVAVTYPSLYEGFGLPVLEAMAHGAAVIASNTSSIAEVAGDCCRLVDPRDVQGLAAGMSTVLRDVTLRRQMASAGRQRAQEFTWETTARETAAVYRRVIGSGLWA